ncbi:MAG: radical SAM protein, partial [Candidatus Aminicenantes bacterium]|nr:radical SAM protein [Candidatus Aminicenantes bacterium]
MKTNHSKEKSDSHQKKKKFIPFVNNFCPRRSLDTSRFYNYFLANGWLPTNRIERSDLVFIYSCGCFKSSEKRSLNTIKTALEKKQPHTEIIVTGCLLKINGKALNGKYKIVPIEEVDVLDSIIGARNNLESIPDANSIYPMKDLISPKEFLIKKFKMDVEFSSLFFKKVRSLFLGRTKYKKTWNIKIADGCLGNCSYCAIRFAAGKVKSKAPDVIIHEFEQGVNQGEKTFVLINNDVGSYGQDIGTNFSELLEQLFSIQGLYKIRILDFNPRWLIQYHDTLLPLFKKNREKIAFLSMPVQSASDRILRLMRRPY